MRIRELLGIILLCLIFLGEEVSAEVSYEEPDGNNGYYLISPEININHIGSQVMRYRLEDANGNVLTGRLDSMMRNVTIQKGILKDGENVLDTWMENENGDVIDSSMERVKYLVDQNPPVYPLSFTRGEVLEISAVDEISGVSGICYAWEGEEEHYLKGEKVFLTIPNGFEGKVWAYAIDNAGNQGKSCYFEIKNNKEELLIPEESEKEEIKDEEKPTISLVGIPEIGITNESIHITCKVSDNQKVTEIRARLRQKLIDETEVICDIEEWKKEENGYSFQRELLEDGIYQIEIEGKDSSGNTALINRRIVIDRTAPRISKLSSVEGKKMKEFLWEYSLDEIVSDLTSWNSEIRLDGVLYKTGQVCKKPGKHILEISARDLAGNESKREATFYIEKPVVDKISETASMKEETEEVFFSKKEEIKISNENKLQKENREEKSTVVYVIGGSALISILILIGIIIKKCTREEST